MWRLKKRKPVSWFSQRNANKYSHLFAETPVFSSTPPKSITVQNIGETIRLNCSAKGSPLPKITWYKDSVIINSTTIVTRDEVASEIEISHFAPLNKGTYTCVARNEYNDEINKTVSVGE